MCGGCGGRSTAVRVARNVPKKAMSKLTNGVIVMRQGRSTAAPSASAGGVRVARNRRK